MKLLLLLSALLAALPASPQTKLSDINTRGVLRVGSTGDYKPFSYRSGKDFIGLDIDLAGELAQALLISSALLARKQHAHQQHQDGGQQKEFEQSSEHDPPSQHSGVDYGHADCAGQLGAARTPRQWHVML